MISILNKTINETAGLPLMIDRFTTLGTLRDYLMHSIIRKDMSYALKLSINNYLDCLNGRFLCVNRSRASAFTNTTLDFYYCRYFILALRYLYQSQKGAQSDKCGLFGLMQHRTVTFLF